MPCWTTTTVSVDIRKLNLERVKTVIKENSFRANVINGQLEIYGSTPELVEKTRTEIMREYAAQTIKDASKRFGWRVAGQSVGKTGNITLNLKR